MCLQGPPGPPGEDGPQGKDGAKVNQKRPYRFTPKMFFLSWEIFSSVLAFLPHQREIFRILKGYIYILYI